MTASLADEMLLSETALRNVLPNSIKPRDIDTEWIQLETATEVISQLIGHYAAWVSTEEKKPQPDLARIEQAEQAIKALGRERQACYLSVTADTVIKKAYTVYAPIVRQLNQSYVG